jgi:glycosyltransferase involved in cell wall biosynthesis
MNLSIIIPTFDNVEYLNELFNSIGNNITAIEYEVLIGIDSCEKTKEFLKSKKFPKNYHFFYFLQNKGPYVIKNTLAELTKYDKILFFDSDDLMVESCIDQVSFYLDKYECVKPKFDNFKDSKGKRNFDNLLNQYGEGVFGINKNLFLSMNGFEGWICAADSDFMGRLYKTKRKIGLTKDILFHRRVHRKSLTKRSDTGYASNLRAKYFSISKNKTYFGPLSNLEKNDYLIFDTEHYLFTKPKNTDTFEKYDQTTDLKKKKHELVNGVFDLKKVKETTKKPEVINYNKVNQNTNFKTKTNLSDVLKKVKLENIQKNSRRR